MLRQNIVNLYAHGSRVDLIVAEKDVVLTYALKVLEQDDSLNLVFKGGTCLRKCYFGGLTRFSEDLDFQGAKKSTLRNEIQRLFQDTTHYGIRLSFEDSDWYETENSCGVTIHYSHIWNPGSTFKFQVSFRGKPVLPPSNQMIRKESYSRWLEFSMPYVSCMGLDEIIAEKIRACYQRSTVRDLYDLYFFSKRPFNDMLIRLLVVLKFWEVYDVFNPGKFLESVSKDQYNWHDLKRLIRKDSLVAPETIIKSIGDRFSFLKDLDDDETLLIRDAKRHTLVSKQKSLTKNALDLYDKMRMKK